MYIYIYYIYTDTDIYIYINMSNLVRAQVMSYISEALGSSRHSWRRASTRDSACERLAHGSHVWGERFVSGSSLICKPKGNRLG